MIKKTLFALLVTSSSLFAHTAIMSCFDNADGTITCEGGFSDGSSASGVSFYVLQDDKEILSTKLNEDSEVTFDKPRGEYSVLFDSGEGHEIEVKGSDITE